MPKKGETRKWDAENMKKAIQAVRGEKIGTLLASNDVKFVICTQL